MPELGVRDRKKESKATMARVSGLLRSGSVQEKRALYRSADEGERAALAACLSAPGQQARALTLLGRRLGERLFEALEVTMKVNPQEFDI
ncbi:MAG: hypothetical protein Q8P45_01490 [Candidatus Harrisonbacteria bacterium]|nr:hypothetical protein [Candidatus Harrisonbacteria bacterium]